MHPVQAERWLRFSVAGVWLSTGLLVLHPYFREIGNGYLSRLGLGQEWMVGACLLEIGLALWLVARPLSGWIVLGQVLAISGFTATLAWLQPLLLAHPFGALSKNLPLLAVLVTAWMLPSEGWSPRVRRLLRVGMASIWFTEGIFPKLLFQQREEVEIGLMLWPSEAGVHWGIAGLGLAQSLSGVGALKLEGRPLRWLLSAQLAALLVLPALVSLALPQLWAHPFGPLTKNLPILVGTYLLLRTCPTSS